MRSDEYENGGWDSATARPAHTAQNAKNHKAPRQAASRSAATRTYRPGSLRRDARYPAVTLPAASGSTKRAATETMAQAEAKTRNIARQPISSFSQPPTIRPRRMPAEIPAVTMPSTVAPRSGFAKRPATELNWAPTDEPAPITPTTRARSHGVPTTALTPSAMASAP